MEQKSGIEQALAPLCGTVKVELTPRLRALRNVVHLLTPIEAVLRSGVSVAEVVLALHPTPAVGGVPRESALDFLARHEPFDRGWYTGAVGWQGAGTASMFVALRAALIRGHRATLFVGAGLVAGSEEESEWRETEAKSRPMVEALGAHPV